MYTPVPVVMAGDWIDEVFINTYWGDNMAAGVPDIFTAVGDLAIGSGPDSAGVLPVGSNGQLLVVDSSEPLGIKWGGLSRTVLTRSSSQSMGGAGTAFVTWDQEIVDDEDLHNNVTNNTRLTFASPGLYLVGFILLTQPGVSAVAYAYNGVEEIFQRLTTSPTGTSCVCLVKAYFVGSGDYIEIRITASGATSFGGNTSRFWALKLS